MTQGGADWQLQGRSVQRVQQVSLGKGGQGGISQPGGRQAQRIPGSCCTAGGSWGAQVLSPPRPRYADYPRRPSIKGHGDTHTSNIYGACTWRTRRSSVGIPSSCRLSQAESELRCRVPGGKLCSGRGACDCGVCICQVTEAGKYYGPLCECHDWVCESYDGKTCAGHGKCDCGKCKCDDGWYGEACQYPTTCNLTRKKSNEMCKNSQDIICSGAGTCQCGRCKCGNSEGTGMVYGKFCECDDRECIDDETEEICTGHGKCYCGNCYCEAGWHGDKCEFQCDITPWEIKKRCTSPDGKICSNRGTCVCGECTCHDVDPTGDWGDIHGDTCECDERNCKAVYDRYSDDFCSGHGQCNCGRCDCKEGWTGKKCEHPRSCPLSVEESAKKCQGNSNLLCSGR
ncbi:PREDICTED: integrin beta-like protein 1, partial [Tinamus guttatus]|uniref:integrin beta-like protein 1 n=1 Tax=Tinamus guttatus TaxID=94827 RepID=UPI00052F304E